MEEERTENWKRPSNVVYPKTYYTFISKDPKSQSNQNTTYSIQDIPECRFNETVEFLLENYLPDEPTMASRNGSNDPKTVEDMITEWRYLLDKKVSQMCTKTVTDEIVAIHILEVRGKDDETEILGMSKNYLDQYCMMEYILEMSDIFNRFKVDQYLRSCGSAVKRDYRKNGIASEMYKGVLSTLEDFGLELCSASFSSAISVKAAKKAGFENSFEISFIDLYKLNNDLFYPGIKSESMVQMNLWNAQKYKIV